MRAERIFYENRSIAGKVLAESLQTYHRRFDAIVFGLARGGVPVAYEVACALQLPFDVFLVRKIGMPGHEEFALGAVAADGVSFFNDGIDTTSLSREVEQTIRAEKRELARRQRKYRGLRPFPKLEGTTVILVDDGMATGASMQAAVLAVKGQNAAHVVVAIPVAPSDTCNKLRSEVDALICPLSPEPFGGVGRWYQDFTQISDTEVIELLNLPTRPFDAVSSLH